MQIIFKAPLLPCSSLRSETSCAAGCRTCRMWQTPCWNTALSAVFRMSTSLGRATFSLITVPVLMQILSLQIENSRCLGWFFLKKFKFPFSKWTEIWSECMPINEMGNTSMCKPHVKPFATDLKLRGHQRPFFVAGCKFRVKSSLSNPWFQFSQPQQNQ